MGEAFIIMQIGDPDLDEFCDAIFVPAITATGLTPRRVDRHNTGDLLKSEIVAFIERADIIVADLTNERPNCYLEVGYAMGLGKKKNLILTAREDHHHDSPNHVRGGPKVHFDLEGYDILFWDPDKRSLFMSQLEERIRRRLAIVTPSPSHSADAAPSMVTSSDTEWLTEHSAAAHEGWKATDLPGYMEAVAILQTKGAWGQQELLRAVEESQIKTFGWPIGLVLDRDEYRPHPTAGGVVAEITIAEGDGRLGRPSYDYWAILRGGDIYVLRSLFEDSRQGSDAFYFNTRIVQVSELLLFLARCYSRLDVAPTTSVNIRLTHGGLKGRNLSAAGNRQIFQPRTTREDEITTSITCTLAELESNLVANVRSLLAPVFVLFDFFELGDEVWEDIVNKFVAGEVT